MTAAPTFAAPAIDIIIDPELKEILRIGGLCYDPDAEIAEEFFPEKGGNTNQARRVCMACPALAQCRAYAMARPYLEGVWGGTSADERKKLRRGQRINLYT